MTTFDPLRAPADSPGLEELRAGCPVARSPAGPWYLARHADVLAATQDIDLFQASFREPGIVVPDEEQLINEIPEPAPRSGPADHQLGDRGAPAGEHRALLRGAVQRPARRPVHPGGTRSTSCTTT